MVITRRYLLLLNVLLETIKLPGYPDPIPIQSILWLEGQAGYTRLHRQEEKALMVTQPLHTFEHYPGLVRIHRSTIINTLHTQKFVQQKGRTGWVELANRTILPVSRGHLKTTAARLGHLTPSAEEGVCLIPGGTDVVSNRP